MYEPDTLPETDPETREGVIAAAVTRLLEGDLRAIGEELYALPLSHPRRRILLANYRSALALLGDLPGILAR